MRNKNYNLYIQGMQLNFYLRKKNRQKIERQKNHRIIKFGKYV